MSTASTVRMLRRAVHDAEERYYEAVRATYPIGARIVHFKHSSTGVLCEVLDHNYSDGLRVRSLVSGKTYWITAYHIDGQKVSIRKT